MADSKNLPKFTSGKVGDKGKMETMKTFMRSQAGAVSVHQIMGIIFAVILVVVGLVMLPLVLDQTTTARNNSNIGYFTGTKAIIDLIPLLYSVGVLGLAGFVALVTLRSK